MDISNEDGYENANVFHGILMRALRNGMKERAGKISIFQRFVGLKQAALKVKIYL